MFQWEFVRDHYIDPVTGRRLGQEFVEAKRKPVSRESGIDLDGLEEASEEVARWVQNELHARGDEPLPILDAAALWNVRVNYQNALLELEGHHRCKAVERRVAPHGRPLAICVGSNRLLEVPVFFHGRPHLELMHGYHGCLRTFPVADYGPGRPEARWCKPCRSRKTNAKNLAIREFQKRMAAFPRV